MSVTGRIIVADTPAGQKRFGPNWRYCVGSGHMGLALRQEHQDALALVQREIGFSYIRGHGLLSDAVGLYREKYWNHADDLQARPGLNFTYVDLTYDSFLAKGIRPFVELGFMPDDLASGDQTCFWWRGNITLPAAGQGPGMERYAPRKALLRLLDWRRAPQGG